MVEPTGYTALDLIGFTDKGPYDPTANYVRNDLVHVGNSTWRCKIDDTTGITPTEGANWTIFIESATSLAGMSDVTLTSPKNGDGLVHDGNDWKNVPIMTKEQWKKNGAYNLCPNENTTQVIDGVTFTVNSDGSVTANGTCGSTGADFDVPNRNTYNLGIGTYKLVGCPSGGGTSKYMIGGKINGSWIFDSSIDTGNGAVINVISAINAIIIRIKPGTVCNNLLFKPMITTDLNATYDDFVPYAKTNRDLTEDTRKIITITDTMPSSAGNKSVGGCPTGYILIGADVYNTSNSRWDSMPIGVFADRPAYITSYTDSTTTYARPYLESGGVTPYGGQTFRALFMKVN